MFGYILPDKPEMKIREYNQFRAYYCGVCKAIGKRCGQFSRMLLNYDSAFLALLLSALSGTQGKFYKESCIANPVKKKAVLKENPFIDYASDMNIFLTYYKLKDDWEDERSVPAAGASLLLLKSVGSIRKQYPEKVLAIGKYLEELKKLEKDGCNSMDVAAEPFARIMEEVMYFEPACGTQADKDILKWIGYNIGKWIYLLDAYDDIDKDIKKKRYNVLLRQFEKKDQEDTECFKERIRERIRFNLTYCLAQVSKGYELMVVKINKSIVDNLIYAGMLKKMEQILDNGRRENCEKSV